MSATVAEELHSAIVRLREAGVESPQLDAQLLMGRAIGASRLDIVAHPERVLTEEESVKFRLMLEKRASRYPLAYILGERGFFGLTLAVTPAVLIPRPETEILVEQVIARLSDGAAIADVGTGTGAIAIALAVNLPSSRMWATDTSEEALKVARINAEKHGVSERVNTVSGDLLDPLIAKGLRFDAVVSNPPYIPTSVIETLEPEVRREPIGALDGGVDGLDAYRKLFPQAAKCTMLAAVEFGIGQGGSVADIAKAAGFPSVEIVPDLAGIERVAIAHQ
jgi:release factor glutamine methyltransferase